MASLAPAGPQRGGPDPVLGAELPVQLEQVVRHGGGDAGPQALGLLHLLADLLESRVPPGGDLVSLAGQCALLLRERIPAALDRLLPLHHVEHDLFQVGLTARQRGDLRLQILQFPGRGHLASVQPGLVAFHPGPDLVDIRLGLCLFPAEVASGRLQRGQLIAEFGVPGLDPLVLLELGQAAPTVVETAELGVQVGQLEQPQLRLRRCFHESSR